ncbi:monocarboxylate transporter 2-like [Bicyclus anynana]|uniref:Monocarboxylate transporter 2-like n=1 Tax=Bicyclus anynana TaxID=110368 RepID=A0ABM3LIR9_BICAN|nr:monocarboxylate transporter 2-like [Bicyclus anynana]
MECKLKMVLKYYIVKLLQISITAFVPCFGVIYKELFIQLKMDSTNITLFNGITCFGIAISGFITSALLNYFSFRQLGLIGASIFNVGMFGTVFTQSKLHFFFFQGLLQSIGHGIVINITFTVTNNYFVKKRLFAVSLTQTISAAFGLVTPRLVKWAIEVYGFRGCVMLITGVSMHNMFAMMLMQPVEWHMKKVEILDDNEKETKSLLEEDKKITTNKENLTASMNSYNKSEHAAIEAIEESAEVPAESNILKQVKSFPLLS